MLNRVVTTLRRSMFIQTHATPNPHALKFTPNLQLFPANGLAAVEVATIKDALLKSDLAFKLLSIDDKRIASVLLGPDFVTIVKSPLADDWPVLKPQIFSVLSEHLAMGLPALKPEYLQKLTQAEAVDEDADLSEYDEIVLLIKELIQTRIRPAILEDGGDVLFMGFDLDSGVVSLKLIGACKSCGSSEVTLKNGIEEMLRYYIDEVKLVEQVKDDDDLIEASAETADASTNSLPSQSQSHSHSHSHSNSHDLPPSL